MGSRMQFFILLVVYCLQNCLQTGNTLTLQTCKNCKQDLATCLASNGVSTGIEGCSELCSIITGNDVCVVDNTVHTCQSHSCQNPIPGDNFTLYRKSTSTDCPKYTIEYTYGHKGLCDVIMNATSVTSYHECVVECLDLDGCRGFTYNNTGSVCEFHNCTDSIDVNSTEVAFFRRICDAPGQGCPLSGKRTCTNCDVATDCPLVHTKSLDKVTCADRCDGEENCVSVYSPHNNTCWTYGCSQIQQFAGRFTYRPSCSMDCPSFTLYELTGRQGSCAVIDSTLGVLTKEECLSLCLDIDGCLGVTYRSIDQVCLYHSCTNDTVAGIASTTFVGLECNTQVCADVTYTQTCSDCKEGDTCVALSDISFTSAYECQIVGTDSPGTIFSVYEEGTTLCSTYDCSGIDSAEGYTVYRKSCSQDCPYYKLEVLWRHGALGDVISNHTDVLSLYVCEMTCLDMDGCRGALYNSVDLTCFYYNSSDAYYDGSPDITFISRICNYTDCVRTEYQTCINCKEHAECNIREIYAMDKSECEDLCASKTDQSCVFEPYLQQKCMVYDCPKIEIYDGYTTFRETCTTDCPYYYLEEMVGHEGTCAIMTAEWNLLSPIDCLNRCLDMEGCRGVTYQVFDNSCYYHNGTNTTDTGNTGVTFYKRVCNFKLEQNCNQTFSQTCVNCKVLDSCETYPGGFHGSATESRCSKVCEDILTTRLCMFGPDNGRCSAYYACGGLEPTEGHAAIRKTCTTDCPYFKLAVMIGYVGDGDVITSDSSITSYFDCQEHCFDMSGCRGVTFYSSTGVCTYHNSSSATLVSGVSNEIFIQRDCDYRDCDRNFTQSCRRCKQSSTCGWDVWDEPFFVVDYNCSDWCRDFDNCTSASYIRRNERCQMKECTEVEPDTFDDKVVYRESCTNDCPQFEIELFEDTIGNCTPTGDSGFDVIIDYQHCLSRCLDKTGCTATSFDNINSKCYFYTTCNSTLPSVGDKFVTITCQVESPRLYTQKCLHCDLDLAECAGNFSHSKFDNYSECDAFCDAMSDCHTAVYVGSISACNLYQCSLSKRSYGSVSFRKTYSPECLEFEIRFYNGYVAHSNCSQIATSKEYSSSYCFSRCLDEPVCKGASYDTPTRLCSLHACNDMEAGSEDTVFIEKICYPEQCLRNFSQTCIDCAASAYCQEAIYKYTSAQPSIVINSSKLWTDNITSVWYTPDYDSNVQYLNCHWLKMDLGHTLIRAACAGDCPWFEIFIVPAASGTCNVTGVIKGGISLQFCLEQCLDTAGCMGATYNSYKFICYLHECNNYTFANSSAYEFINRRCIEQSETCDANVTQTCINCRVGNDCMDEYNSTEAYFEHECRDLISLDNSSVIVHYDRGKSLCMQYECKQVGVEMEHVVYRQSCNQECPQFELFYLKGRMGTCGMIEYHEGGLKLDYCVEKCIDLPGCLGTTFDKDLERCTYHNCTDSVYATTGHYFVKKVCVDEIPVRENIQTCYNCKSGNECQKRYYSYPHVLFQKFDSCFHDVSSHDDTSWATVKHQERDGVCRGLNCTFISQFSQHYQTIRRKSYTTDCPHFEVYKIASHQGTCSQIDSDEGFFPLDYCITKCLDLEGCRGVTHIYGMNCTYHNCTDHEASGTDLTFVKRICFNPADEPVRSHTQACINCDNDCKLTLVSQNNNLKSSECAFTNSETRSITFREWSGQMSCYEYSCDQPYLENRDGTILRKTYNTDCSKFEVHVVYLGMAPCEHTHYDEGIYHVWLCLHRCMDMSGCRSTDYQWTTKRCYYYNCTEYIPATNATWTVHFEKECLSPAECISPTMQRCLNCDVSTECQLPFQTDSSATDTVCSGSCAGNSDCDVAVLDTSQTCSLYQCGRIVTSHIGTEVFRPSCDNTDCPLYELYTVNDEVGTCNPYIVEQFMPNASLCMRRCMDLPNCRAITHFPNWKTCHYHRCDCSQPARNTSATFMWKYCLNDINNRTIIPSSCLADPLCDVTMFYPREIIACDTTTTSTTTTTTTTTTPVPTTTVNMTALRIGAIFIRPCLCGTGEFINWTVSQVAVHMSDSLLIDRRSTSKAWRLKNSSPDNRTSVQVLGGSGVAVLLSLCVVFLALDSGNWYKSIIHFRRIIRRIIRYCKVRRISSYSENFNIIGEVYTGNGDGTLVDLEYEAHSREASKNYKSDKQSAGKTQRNKYDVLIDPLDNIEHEKNSQSTSE